MYMYASITDTPDRWRYDWQVSNRTTTCDGTELSGVRHCVKRHGGSKRHKTPPANNLSS